MFYDMLKKECNRQGIKLTPLVVECGGAKSNVTSWKNGTIPKIDMLVKLADRLNVSTDYLLGRNFPTQVTNTVDINTNHGVGQINAPVTIKNGQERVLSKQEQDLLRIYNAVDGMSQTDIMRYVYGIEQKNK